MSFKRRLLDKASGADQQQLVDQQSQEAHLQLQADRLATQRDLISAKSDLQTALVTVPYNTGNIIAAKGKILKLKAGLHELDTLEKEEFAD